MDKTPSDALGTLKDELSEIEEPYLVGENREHRTIQSAYDDAMTSGISPHLKTTAGYDPRKESYPIQFKGVPESRDWIPFALDGRNVATIGRPGVTGDVIQIHGPPGGGQECYKKPATLRGFRVEGGSTGAQIHIAGVPNGRIQNVVCAGPGDGVFWSGPYLDMDVGMSHSFGWNLNSVTSWGTKAGFKASQSAGAHSTTFTDCRANACRNQGLYFEGAASVTWRGGDIQLCHGYGASIRGCDAFTIRDAYIEGNSRGKSTPLELYGKDADSLTINSNYFHGINPRTTPGHDHKWVQRCVNVHDSQGVTITENQARRYGEGLVTAMSGSEIEARDNHFPTNEDGEPTCALLGVVGSDSTVTEYGQPLTGDEGGEA